MRIIDPLKRIRALEIASQVTLDTTFRSLAPTFLLSPNPAQALVKFTLGTSTYTTGKAMCRPQSPFHLVCCTTPQQQTT